MGSNPQSQFASQIVTEVLQIEELLPQTAYRNSATPYTQWHHRRGGVGRVGPESMNTLLYQTAGETFNENM